jgi:hypothetical protein
VVDLFVRAEHGERARAAAELAPAMLRALTRRGRRGAASVASLRARAEEAGLSLDALARLRGLAENSSAALVRNACATALGRGDHVESRQQQAAVAVHDILVRQGQAAPVYVFGHTHRVAHCALHADSAQLLWFNGGAWVDASYGFVEVDGRADGVVARLCRWDPVALRADVERSVSRVALRRSRARADYRQQVGRPGGDPVTL